MRPPGGPNPAAALAIAAGLLIAAPAAAAPCGVDRYACAADAYRAGDLAAARASVDALLAEQPDNPDALLLSGILYLRSGDLPGGRRALDRAATLAPRYADVLVARARLNFREGKREAARRDIENALSVSPGHAEATALRGEIVVVPAEARWSAAIDQSISRLVPRRASAWHETLVTIARRRGAMGLSLEVEHARRFGTSDVRFQLRGDRSFGGGPVYAAIVATADPDFRESWGLRAGGARAAHRQLDLLIDGRFSNYRGANSGSITAGARAWTADRRTSLRGSLINFIDETGRYRAGAAADLSHAVSSRLRLQGGYARYPETEAGVTRRIESVFAGATYQASETLNIRAGLERETREGAYRRNGASFGLSVNF